MGQTLRIRLYPKLPPCGEARRRGEELLHFLWLISGSAFPTQEGVLSLWNMSLEYRSPRRITRLSI